MSFTRQFPDEVLLLIVYHTIPQVATITTLGPHLATLYSLCLTSRRLRELAREVLYQDLVLRTPAEGRSLLKSIQDRANAQLLRRTASTLLFAPARSSQLGDTEWTAEVLAGLAAPELGKVGFQRVVLCPAAFWALKGTFAGTFMEVLRKY